VIFRKGKPTLFITMTANPRWKEIVGEEPQRGKKSRPRKDPGIIARVFKLKLEMLMDDIKSGRVFGSRGVYDVQVIEFQKRGNIQAHHFYSVCNLFASSGLPHAHILVKLEEEWDVSEMDDFISTRVPGEDEPELREAVLRHMVHGPCGLQNLASPCMDEKTKSCTKAFPKPFEEATFIDERGMPVYKRVPEPKATVKKAGREFVVDSSCIVPYNPDLLLKYNCHINVEWASSAVTVKYLFKVCLCVLQCSLQSSHSLLLQYMMKGPDRALALIAQKGVTVDEISDFENRRYLGAAEAHWRLYAFPITSRHPAVKALSVHLPDKQYLVFKETEMEAALKRTTELQRYFARPAGSLFDSLTFQDYYEAFIEKLKADDRTIPHPDKKHHLSPRVKGEIVMRLQWVFYTSDEKVL
jgi:hypothetical protein